MARGIKVFPQGTLHTIAHSLTELKPRPKPHRWSHLESIPSEIRQLIHLYLHIPSRSLLWTRCLDPRCRDLSHYKMPHDMNFGLHKYGCRNSKHYQTTFLPVRLKKCVFDDYSWTTTTFEGCGRGRDSEMAMFVSTDIPSMFIDGRFFAVSRNTDVPRRFSRVHVR
jgi:hypothetical protein